MVYLFMQADDRSDVGMIGMCHSRTTFRDRDEPDRRHLVRIFLRDEASAASWVDRMTNVLTV